jgi:nucleotide-binding universal stress UspA family protein
VVAVVAATPEAPLVTESQRHGRAAEFLFGRVTNECLRHTDVPVVLIPANTRAQ